MVFFLFGHLKSLRDFAIKIFNADIKFMWPV